jgi:hypothetical protein
MNIGAQHDHCELDHINRQTSVFDGGGVVQPSAILVLLQPCQSSRLSLSPLSFPEPKWLLEL